MIRDLGTVRPGSTLYVPFHTFDSNDPSASVTLTGLAVTDIEIYKDGGTTQRASDAGYTLLDTDGIDFDAITGIHGFSIDLADNTTAGFWSAGSRYFVVVSSVTVDAATINFVACTFTIGYPGAILDTTIATLASQTSFTLTAGSADNDAYNGCVVVVHDAASAVQVAQGVVSDYTGATKTVTLAFDPAIFTMAASDNISLFPRVSAHAWNGVPLSTTNPLPNAAADAAGGLPISDAGGLDLDAKLAATNEVTAARMGALTDWINGGRLDLILDIIAADVVGLDGAAMRGTDAAALASVCTEARLSELDAATSGKAAFVIDALDTLTKAAGPGDLAAILTDTADMQPKLGAPAGASVSADIAAVKTDTAAILVDTGTTLDGNITSIKTTTDKFVFTVANQVNANMLSISGDGTAADNLEESATAIVSSTAKAGTLSTTQMSTNLTEATDDHYIGRTVIWTTGVLAGQASDITDYAGVNGVLSYSTLTEAPSAGDGFVIV